MDPSVMRQMMGKDAAPASYFLFVKMGIQQLPCKLKTHFLSQVNDLQ